MSIAILEWVANKLGLGVSDSENENEEEKSEVPQTNGSCLNDVVSYFQTLNSGQDEAQTTNFLGKDQGLPTVSHYFRTGHLYRGKHRDALSWFSEKTPENKEFAKLAIALIERIAQIAPEKLDNLQLINLDGGAEAEQEFVRKLHEIYKDVAREHYEALRKNVETTITDHLFYAYGSKKGKALLLNDEHAKALTNYIPLVLRGEDFTAAKKALKEASEEENVEVDFLEGQLPGAKAYFTSKKEKLKSKLRILGVDIGKLTYDAQYYATQLGKHKDELDKQFRDFKKDINRVAQEIGTHERGLKHRSLDSLLNDPWGQSYEDVDLTPDDAPVSEDKQKRRSIKERIFKYALTIAVLLAFGESVVAAVGIAGLSMTGALLIIVPTLVFCSAIYANYSLVLRDTYDTLKGIWEGQTFLDKDGKPLSLSAKIGVWVVGVFFSFCSSAAYAALSAQCLWPKALAVATHLLPVAAATGVAGFLTAIVAIATALGLGIIFFVQVANFIKERKWEKIGAYLKKEFWWDADLSKNASWKETFAHWASNGLKFIKLVLGLSTTFLITFISFGLFKEKIGGWVGMIPRLAANIGGAITLILTWGNALVMSTFGVSKNQSTLDRFTLGGFTAAVVEFGLGVISIPFLMLETVGRCGASLKGVTQELAPVSTGRALNWACGAFEGFVGRISSYFQTSPTFSPELVVVEAANTDALPGPIKKVLKTHAYIQKRFMNNAGLVPNSVGQAALFAPYGPPALPSFGTLGATISTAVCKFAFSLLPNRRGAVEAQNADRVAISEQTIRGNASAA